jgi:hypothetical protein
MEFVEGFMVSLVVVNMESSTTKIVKKGKKIVPNRDE